MEKFPQQATRMLCCDVDGATFVERSCDTCIKENKHMAGNELMENLDDLFVRAELGSMMMVNSTNIQTISLAILINRSSHTLVTPESNVKYVICRMFVIHEFMLHIVLALVPLIIFLENIFLVL